MLISDVFQFAREGRVWKGVFPLLQMERLADVLGQRAGEVQVTLVGGVDDRALADDGVSCVQTGAALFLLCTCSAANGFEDDEEDDVLFHDAMI